MGYEIDFLPDGDGERGGEAITLRCGNLSGQRSEYAVIVIDGGTKDTGKALVEHIKKYYGTEQVDLVISTHPDGDHSSGLSVVLEELDVKLLWMHRPWEHAKDIKDSFKDGRITTPGLKKTIIKALEDARNLEEIANRKDPKIPIIEPFGELTTDCNKSLLILGPSKDYYEQLLPNFRETPEPKESASLLKQATVAIKEAINWVAESWGIETLTDPQPNETSAENNSSVIVLLQLGTEKFLFMGDAGVEAISAAILKAASLGIDLKGANFIHMPHHGSKHNLGPTLLNSLIGSKVSEQETGKKVSFVSAPQKGDPKHPSRKVANAFRRRGVRVYATKGSKIWHHSADAPARNWGNAVQLPFYVTVGE